MSSVCEEKVVLGSDPGKSSDSLKAKRDLFLIHQPYFCRSIHIRKKSQRVDVIVSSLTQKSSGIGIQAVERHAKTLIAHSSPRALNIDGLKRGNAAPQMERNTTVAAMALAK